MPCAVGRRCRRVSRPMPSTRGRRPVATSRRSPRSSLPSAKLERRTRRRRGARAAGVLRRGAARRRRRAGPRASASPSRGAARGRAGGPALDDRDRRRPEAVQRPAPSPRRPGPPPRTSSAAGHLASARWPRGWSTGRRAREARDRRDDRVRAGRDHDVARRCTCGRRRRPRPGPASRPSPRTTSMPAPSAQATWPASS